MYSQLLQVKSLSLKKIVTSFYSNISYSVFKTNLNPEQLPKKFKQSLGKFKWRNNVVSLRAPKHFKVGRQHYNRSKRITKVTFKNTLEKKINKRITTTLTQSAIFAKHLKYSSIQQPLSTIKNTQVYVKLTIQINNIKS